MPVRLRWFVALVACVPLPLDAQRSGATPTARPAYRATDTNAGILRDLDRWLGAMAAHDSLPGVVAVAHEGTIVLSRAAGMADERAGTPITPETRFTLASVGKMFTAVAIAQLLEQGRLSLSDTVGRFLPGYPNRDVARRVTVEHLLNHTSGMGLFWNDRYFARRDSLFTTSDYLPLFADEPLRFTPGERLDYSNNGYIVLGLIIEALSGVSYYDYVQRHIFDRAGMRNTGFYDRNGQTPHGAVGYGEAGRPAAPPAGNLGVRELRGSPAGGGYATAADMITFMDALVRHKLVGGSTMRLFTTGKVDGMFGPKGYGYGFITRTRGDTVAFGHTGGFEGMTNQVFHFPNSGYTLVVLLNRSGASTRPIMGETLRAIGGVRAQG